MPYHFSLDYTKNIIKTSIEKVIRFQIAKVQRLRVLLSFCQFQSMVLLIKVLLT